MEKINNKIGSSTVEAVIIIPIVLIFIMTVTIIMLLTYEKTSQVIVVHRSSMTGEVNELSVLSDTNVTHQGNNTSINETYYEGIRLEYTYKRKTFDTRDIQNLVELLFYLSKEYSGDLKELVK